MNSQQKRSSLISCSSVVDANHPIDTTTNQIQFFTSNKSSSSSQVYLFDVKFPKDGSQKVKVAVFRHTIMNGSKKRKYEECCDDEDDPEQTAFKKVKELSNNKAGNYDEIEIRDCDVDLGDVAAIQYPVSACFNQPVEQNPSSACYNPNVIERRHKPQSLTRQ